MKLHLRNLFKKAFPHLLAIVIFNLITLSYFSPLFSGKKIYQGDIVNFKGMSKEIIDYRESTGEEALWTNRMFGGMPAYQISYKTSSNLINIANKIISFNYPREASFIIISFISFYILLLCMNINPYIAIIGALGYGLSTYLFIIIEAGHNTKAEAMAYMPAVLGSILFSFRTNMFSGAILTALFLSLQIRANHLQITYYLLLMIILFGFFEFFHSFKEKKINNFFKTTSILFISASLAICCNIENLWSTYDYGKYSTRSKSELIEYSNLQNKTSGLDKDYATSWSYGKLETFNVMIPNLFGGASNSKLSDDSQVYQVLKNRKIPNAKNIIKRFPTYWGEQPFTSGPVYIGSVLCFLFLFSLFFLEGRLKWWLISCSILSVLLAWGKNMMWLTDFFLDYVPGYNKFRTVSMILVILELTIPFLGILSLNELIKSDLNKTKALKSLKYSGLIFLCICFFFITFSSFIFDFSSKTDNNIPDFLLGAIKSDRYSMLISDSFRSIILILFSSLSIYLLIIKKISNNLFYFIFFSLVICDLIPINLRHLNSENFVKSRKVNSPFKMTEADKKILSDKELNFRVFNTSERLDAGARTSYFHNNIAGYHGAKFKRYQEIMDYQLAKNNSSVINMLNVKYFMFKNSEGILKANLNNNRLGPAWLVNNIIIVNNADDEMRSLEKFDPSQDVLLDKRFMVNDTFFNSSGEIRIKSYKPNNIIYEANIKNKSFAVFSEIYYDKGWNCYINGNKQNYYRVNYILRGMELQKGNYDIEFKFEPISVSYGSNIALISSGLIYFLLFFGIIFKFKI